MHAISQRSDGTAEAMYALQPAWHGLGTVVDHAPTSAAAFKLAGLDWDVLTRPLFYGGVGDNGEDTYNPVKGRVATVRADTGLCLGVVSSKYTVVQNSELFAWCDKLVNTGDVRYESAGALKDGRIVWLLARLEGKTDFVTDGDKLARYLCMYNSHDGTNAVTIVPTDVRVVCWNTLSLASPGIQSENEGDTEATAAALAANRKRGGIIRISHTRGVKMRMDDARAVLSRAGEAFDDFAVEARRLAATRINAEQFETFLDRIIPQPLTGKMPKGRAAARERITELYASGPEQEMCRDTAWAALNAVTHYVDHDWKTRDRNEEDRRRSTLYSVWFGRAGGFKDEARRAALELVTA
jgi:phage/plasmid-like protein (TIGR03299 family)